MDRKRGTDKIADFEDDDYSMGGSGVDTFTGGANQDIFICNQEIKALYLILLKMIIVKHFEDTVSNNTTGKQMSMQSL